jgi:hypothetical protein
MLHQRQTGASSKLCVNKGSVGSIFVPTRITEPSKRDAVTANIAVDRIGLILPQHYNEPVVHQAPVTPVAAGELFSSRALQQDHHACACFLPVPSFLDVQIVFVDDAVCFCLRSSISHQA